MIFALSFEIDPFIQALGLVQINTTNPLNVLQNPLIPTKAYEGYHNGIRYRAIWAGVDRFSGALAVQNIGPENALLNALVLLNGSPLTPPFFPDVIVSAGTAGGWSQRLHVGDVVVCANDETNPYYDRNFTFGVPGFQAFANGEYQCADIPTSLLTANGITLGRVATSSVFNPTTCNQIEFLNSTNVDVIDNESAAEAYIAQLLNIPFLSFKIVSNSYKHPNETNPGFPALGAIMTSKVIPVLESLHFPIPA